MATLARRLADHLCSRESVLAAFRKADLRLASELLAGPVEITTFDEPDWQSLLTWASVLSQSDHANHVELALVAAISALTTARSYPEETHQAAVFVLESCSNTQTVKLAQERGLVSPSVSSYRLPALLRRYQRRLQHFIFDDFKGVALPVTDFQERIWDALNQRGNTALSALTSAGKSFVLVRWLAQSLLSDGKGRIVAYIVPSRALISQVRRNITDILLGQNIRPRIISLPTLYYDNPNRDTILVMTQERIERLFAVNSKLRFRTIVIDEAHKLGEGQRGVILQRVIDEALSRYKDCHVVMAVPHAENAGELLPGPRVFDVKNITSSIVTDSRPTVLQNLFWITPILRRRARWGVTLVREKEVGKIGEFQLFGNPTGKKKRFSSLSYHLGKHGGGNIVFTNEPAEAEEIALLLSGHIESDSEIRQLDEEIQDLIRLIKEALHPSYPLAETISHGVGIHYGDMPEIFRREQERLFDEGKLPFLVCTPTLLEGVNLPCRNLFVWGPRQGRGKPMSEHAFWNLAGRAGRWGREFAGNIFCMDVHSKKQWPRGAPVRRYAQKVKHSGSELLVNLDSFHKFVDAPDPADASRKNRYFEQMLGELVGTRLDGQEITSVGWAQWASDEQIKTLDTLVDSVSQRITAPSDIVKHHRGINPILISQFMDYLGSLPSNQAEFMMPMTPDMHDARAVLSENLRIIDENLGGSFGNQRQRNFKSSLTISWMRGIPLGRIIQERIKFLTSQKKHVNVPVEIRSVIGLIDENARFLIPKYLTCYSECVAHWFALIDRQDLANEIADIQDMLESGVAEKTMIALIGLGLSRTAAVELASRIPNTELSINGVIAWLRDRPLEPYAISPVIVREVKQALEASELI